MKRAVIYSRVSTLDQNPQMQLLDLQQLASQRGFEVIDTYVDHGFSGVRVKRPALDRMLADARRGRFEVLLVWSCDRVARSTRHLLDVLDELNQLNIQFVSFREALDTSGPLGRAITIIIGAIAELERSLIIERVRAGMRRAKLEGRHIGRHPLVLDQSGILRDRAQGMSLRQIGKTHRISTATVTRVLRETNLKGAEDATQEARA
jgi:DNA invertase Pin-like site-specific DNA recombinase